MKIYHQLGHNHKWALDSFFQNDIGDGFIFNAYSFKYGAIGNTISTYKPAQYLKNSMVDLQYYGSKDSVGGALDTYPFNPIALGADDSTLVHGSEFVVKGVEYQISLGIKDIIVPTIYYSKNDIERIIELTSRINKRLRTIKKNNPGIKLYMTIPFDNETIINGEKVEKLLQAMTDINIEFDGYYVVCDYSPEYKKKISVDYDYYNNLLKVFSVLKNQGFKTIYGYANWDSLIFNSLTDIDYTTIGTYENLRRFNIKRFTETLGGGPSKGWYFSEKLLNFVRAEELKNLRSSGCLGLIANEQNIFSDVILDPKYLWNTHKPEVHKNYLLSISRLLLKLHQEQSIDKRANLLLSRIEGARKLYGQLEKEFKVYLNDENSDYHLGMWASFIKKNISH
jgi:hypothetical protein